MKVAVTGASGFIGRYVLEELSRQPVEVIAAAKEASDLAGICFKGPVTVLDIASPPDDAYERLQRPEVLIHLAWDGLPNYWSLHHYETELPRQYQFIKILIESGLPALVAAGTCFEYGRQFGPLDEQMDVRPDNPYGYAKDSLRRQLEFLRATRPFALTWARLFYLYGEGQPRNSLYTQLREAVARGDSVFNMSGGEQLRDYLPVTDIARYLVALALHHPDVGVVNICSGQPVSIRSLVERWIQENHWTIQLNRGFYPYPDYEPFAFWGNRRKLDCILEDR